MTVRLVMTTEQERAIAQRHHTAVCTCEGAIDQCEPYRSWATNTKNPAAVTAG